MEGRMSWSRIVEENRKPATKAGRLKHFTAGEHAHMRTPFSETIPNRTGLDDGKRKWILTWQVAVTAYSIWLYKMNAKEGESLGTKKGIMIGKL